MMKANLNLLKFLILALVLASCSNDDDVSVENEITIVNAIGILESEKTLTALYNVTEFSPEDYEMANVTVRWWRADNIEGTDAEVIDNATAIQYVLTGAEVGKFVAVEIAVAGTSNEFLRSKFIGPVTGIANTSGVVASSIDTQLFAQIKTVDDALTAQDIWPNYSLINKPMYLLHKDDTGAIDKAYVVNPQSDLTGSVTVPDGENGSINVVRYDEQAQEAFDQINNMGNGLYDFNFTIDGNSVYYTQIYTDEEVLAGEELAAYPGGFFDPSTVTFGAIDFIIHEPFHEFQESWTFNGGFGAIPNTQELYELRALAHQIFKDFPNASTDATTLENKLRQFVAIRSAEIALLGKDIASEGEKLEGTARYVEKITLRNAFAARATEPFIKGSVVDDDYGITDQDILLQVIENLQYEIGASVYFTLNEVTALANTDIESGKTPYEVARDLYTMSQEELDQQLQNAKDAVDFAKIQATATEWMEL